MYSDKNVFVSLCCDTVSRRVPLYDLFTISLTCVEVTVRYLHSATCKASFVEISLDKCIRTINLQA